MAALDDVFRSGSRGPRGVLPRAMLSGTHSTPWVGPQAHLVGGRWGGTSRGNEAASSKSRANPTQSRESGRPGIVPWAALPGTSFCPSVCSPAIPPPPFPQHSFSSCISSDCSEDGSGGTQAAMGQGQRHRGTANGLACAPSSQRPPLNWSSSPLQQARAINQHLQTVKVDPSRLDRAPSALLQLWLPTQQAPAPPAAAADANPTTVWPLYTAQSQRLLLHTGHDGGRQTKQG